MKATVTLSDIVSDESRAKFIEVFGSDTFVTEVKESFEYENSWSVWIDFLPLDKREYIAHEQACRLNVTVEHAIHANILYGVAVKKKYLVVTPLADEAVS